MTPCRGLGERDGLHGLAPRVTGAPRYGEGFDLIGSAEPAGAVIVRILVEAEAALARRSG